jgi:hypothetical protein
MARSGSKATWGKAPPFICGFPLPLKRNPFNSYSQETKLTQRIVSAFIALILITIATTQAPTQKESTKPLTQQDLSILTGNIQRPNGLAWFNNTLYTSCSGDWTVYQINLSTQSTSQYIYGIRNAHTIYVNEKDKQPDIWIPDFQMNALIHINKGSTETVASDLKGPWGITPINDDTFAITSLLTHRVIAVNRSGATRDLITKLKSPAGITSNADKLYIANSGSSKRAIEWYNIKDLLQTKDGEPTDSTAEDHTLITGLQNVTGLTLAKDGYLYFSYAIGTRGVVGRINPTQCEQKDGCSSDDIEIILYTELAAPLAGLTISPDMKLYIHSIFSPDIYWVQLDQEIATSKTNPDSQPT